MNTQKILDSLSKNDRFEITQCDSEFHGFCHDGWITFDIRDITTDNILAYITQNNEDELLSSITIIDNNSELNSLLFPPTESKMDYSNYLFSTLLAHYNMSFHNLTYDIRFTAHTKLYEMYNVSSYNSDLIGEYECMETYIVEVCSDIYFDENEGTL